MKQNYSAPEMEITKVVTTDNMLIVGSGIEMGGEGEPDAKRRTDKPMQHEAHDIEYGNLW